MLHHVVTVSTLTLHEQFFIAQGIWLPKPEQRNQLFPGDVLKSLPLVLFQMC
jgi:hypothetical protein